MPITIQSTTDTPEAVSAAMGDLAKEKIADPQASVASEEPAETADESDTLDAKESDETKESDEKAEDEKSEDGKPKKKGGFKKRIDKLSRQKTEAEQRATYWENEAIKLRDSGKQAKPVETKADVLGKPKAEDFESHEAFVDALTDWKVDQKLLVKEQKAKEDEIKSAHQKRVDDHQSRLKEFVKSHEDFGDVIADVDDIRISPTLQEVILASDNGPDLMYGLAKNRKEYERINSLPPIAMARELGRFEAGLTQSTSKETKTIQTKAPRPIEPVKSTSSGGTKKTIYDQDLSQREYERLRIEQRARRA